MTLHHAPRFLALSLVAALGTAASFHAISGDAKAATLGDPGIEPMSIRCFMGSTGGRPDGKRFDGDLHRGWFCLPEERAATTH